MIRRESGGSAMVPYIPYRWHAGVQRLAGLIAVGPTSEIGATEQVVMERTMPERTQPLVQRQFARDVELLRGLAGDLTSISAAAPWRQTRGATTAVWACAASPARRVCSAAGARGCCGALCGGAKIVLAGKRERQGDTQEIADAGQPTELELVVGGNHRERRFPLGVRLRQPVAELRERTMAGRRFRCLVGLTLAGISS